MENSAYMKIITKERYESIRNADKLFVQLLATLLCLLFPLLPNTPISPRWDAQYWLGCGFLMEHSLCTTADGKVRGSIQFANANGIKPIEMRRVLMDVYGKLCTDIIYTASGVGSLKLFALKFSSKKETRYRQFPSRQS
ncbi:hypothetical protein NPIL_566431 [Nephila pilipes]|uniref:Uncharacterized protein n=1 Tax=Nephila pilipes TaxID=299642 RepID=A0A8X6JYA8_NEPPI|nr:hypothetical protein NPIL_566431 [Nephila pilipes]